MRHRQRGFSLLEVVVSTLVLAFVIGAAMAILFSTQDYQASHVLKESAHIEAKRLLQQLVEEMQDVRSDQIFNRGTTDTPFESNDVEYKKVADLDGNLSDTFALTYQQTGEEAGHELGQLVKTNPDGETVVMARNIMEFDDFTKDGSRTPPSKPGISFTLDEKKLHISVSVIKVGNGRLAGVTEVANYQTTVTLKQEIAK